MRTIIKSLLLASSLSSFAMIGCGGDFVSPELSALNRVSSALSFGELGQVNGQYVSGCTTHDDGDPWCIGSGCSNPLAVVRKNTNCSLSITGLDFADGMTVSNLLADPALTLAGAYSGSPTKLDAQIGGTVKMYFDAMLTDPSFLGNFTINLVYSDDPKRTTDSHSAQYKTYSSTASGSAVPPPNYTLAFSNLVLTVDEDDIIFESSGTVALSLAMGQQAGEHYVVTDTQSLGASPSFAALDADYQAAVAASAEHGIADPIQGSFFGLDGEDVSVSGVQRNLIIKHEQEGSYAFQRILITFNKPTP